MPLHFLIDTADVLAAVEVGDDVPLDGAEAHHAATVRRVRVGEEITLGDGRGLWVRGCVTAVSPRQVRVRVTGREEVPAQAPRLVLVQALAKGDRDELAVQAATELGVDQIVPWQSARSVSRWEGPKAEKGRARWSGIVREASKQAHRAWVPEVVALSSTADVVAVAERRGAASAVFVLEPTAPTRLSDGVRTLPTDVDEIVLVVGPEGGIEPKELGRFEAVGARAVRLGESVLRTSTAGPAALATVATALGRW